MPAVFLPAYRTYQSFSYRYWCCTELTEVSGTGTDVVPNLPKCPVSVIPAVCLGTYRTEHTGGILYAARFLQIVVIHLYALSLRNLFSGFECGRVFPAGGGPGSPSRDAANWLPSRFGLSVETRRRYSWLRMVFPGVRLFRAPWCPSRRWRYARDREHCRGEPGSALSGGYAQDSAKAESSSIVDEPGED